MGRNKKAGQDKDPATGFFKVEDPICEPGVAIDTAEVAAEMAAEAGAEAAARPSIDAKDLSKEDDSIGKGFQYVKSKKPAVADLADDYVLVDKNPEEVGSPGTNVKARTYASVASSQAKESTQGK